jgi:hypothetical protein
MTPHPMTINREHGPFQQRTAGALIVFVALIALGASFLYGQKVRAAVERNTATVIEDENRTFCTSLGVAPATEAYTRCADGLANVRRLHQERFNLEAVGVL